MTPPGGLFGASVTRLGEREEVEGREEMEGREGGREGRREGRREGEREGGRDGGRVEGREGKSSRYRYALSWLKTLSTCE